MLKAEPVQVVQTVAPTKVQEATVTASPSATVAPVLKTTSVKVSVTPAN